MNIKKIAFLFLGLFFFISINTVNAQSIESITAKISDKICDCIDENINSYSEIKNEFNRCYDKEFNMIFSHVDSAEQKIILKAGSLNKVRDGIIPYLNNNCNIVINAINRNIDSAVNHASDKNIKSFPVNFSDSNFNNINESNNKLIALSGKIEKKNDNYYLKTGENSIPVRFLFNPGEINNNNLRLLGYLQKKEDDNFVILSIASVNLNSMNLNYRPGAYQQVKTWIYGDVPKNREEEKKDKQ